MADVNIQLGYKNAAWFTTNASVVLLDGQIVYLNDQSGQYKLGDGVTALSSLSFLGGGGSGAVDSVNGQTGVVVLDTSDIADSTNKRYQTDNQQTFNDATSSIQTQLNAKENSITAGTTSQYWRGDKTFQTLNKSAVGLGNVDNTSDVNKPVSTATQTALDAKYNHINFQCLAVNPTDNQNLYLNGNAIAPATTDTQRAFTFGKVVTIVECYWAIQQSANGDNAQVNVYLRNITTNTNDLLGSFTSDWGAATGKGFVFTGLSITTSATDYYTIYIDCPTWATSNPTAWLINGNLSYR